MSSEFCTTSIILNGRYLKMLRVARKAIFISDPNNFGQGPFLARMVKQTINALGFWNLVDLIKTRSKKYTIFVAQ